MKLLSTFLLLISCLTLSAQNFLGWQYKDRYFSASLGSGNNVFLGDFNQQKKIQEELSHFTLGLEARLWSKVGARVEASYYKIRGRDALAADSSFYEQRNLSFESWNFEMSFQGVFYMREYAGDYHKRWPIDPYLALGVGFTTINPTTEYQDEMIELRPLQTEGVPYAPITFMIPAAAGLKLRINEFVNFNMEIAYRYTFSDYLDDVSGTYPGERSNPLSNALSNRKDEIAIVNQEVYDNLVPGERRGNPNNMDQYMFISLKLEIFLPPGKGPLFSKPGAY